MSIDDNSTNQLDNQGSDYVALVLKSAAGLVPIAGSFLSELAGHVIPNQRVDRIARFAKALEDRVATIESADLKSKLTDEQFSDLAEEVVRNSARATSEDRIQYLAALLANGITAPATKAQDYKHVLRILSELNDVEVIWLRSYLDPTMDGDREFREKHRDVLEPVAATLDSDRVELDQYTIQHSYKEHLTRLGLLRPRYQIDSQTKMPKFDTRTGGQSIRGHDITPLGKLVLRTIDLSIPEYE